MRSSQLQAFPTPESEVDGAWDDFIDALPVEPVLDYTVIRDGQTLDVSGSLAVPAANPKRRAAQRGDGYRSEKGRCHHRG